MLVETIMISFFAPKKVTYKIGIKDTGPRAEGYLAGLENPRHVTLLERLWPPYICCVSGEDALDYHF